MNTNEIRIGNYVFDKQDNIIKITGVTDITLFSDEHFKSGQLIEWCKPIPITKEILLEKIDWVGYKKLYISSYFNIDEVGHIYYRSDYTGININYIHELQNFYFDVKRSELQISILTVP